MNLKNGFGAVLFWSVISAAFIGPGTVTTAATAGTQYGVDLVWVLILSTIACAVLQINVTRITIQSGKTLGELLLENFRDHHFIPIMLGMSIVFGCAAYQAGNLLGAALGVGLLFDVDQRWVLLMIFLLSGSLLLFGSVQVVARILGGIVAVMGITFVAIAFSAEFSFAEMLTGSIIPKLPAGSEIVVMGLIGTTIVPYNLFLGSGLSRGKELNTSITGLILAISIGGVISIAILLSGTLILGVFNFEKLAMELMARFGNWAKILLGIGLFSAGFTSSLTAPLAAAFTMQSIFPNHKGIQNRNSRVYRSIWAVVLAFGFAFGFFNVKPIPAIILAQAVNGIILPFISVFVLMLVGSRENAFYLKGALLNTVLLTVVVSLLVTIGVFNLLKMLLDPGIELIVVSVTSSLLIVAVVTVISLFRRDKSPGH